MLAALMGGQALTASELASRARISRSTASGHLGRLVDARLLAVTQKRRNRYYRIASPLVARMLEGIKAVAAIEVPQRHQPRSIADDQLRFARTCYDHLAGYLGVAIADALVAKAHVVLTDDGGEVTASGTHFLSAFGVVLVPKSGSRRIFCRPCLDWSERRFHVAGHVGAEIQRCCLERGWLRRDRDTRIVHVTPAGQIGLRRTFGISLSGNRGPALAPSPAHGVMSGSPWTSSTE
ncbi:helix-turn-helix domain-containing protein [Bradyrhizobium sp. 21]|uniref:ArsR/SmtB family transcription factor n=1 Tax=Bradyrhizobium sp. 21 TaxID=2782666 RepID=UPI001FFA9905